MEELLINLITGIAASLAVGGISSFVAPLVKTIISQYKRKTGSQEVVLTIGDRKIEITDGVSEEKIKELLNALEAKQNEPK
jgi:hypothetical protein